MTRPNRFDGFLVEARKNAEKAWGRGWGNLTPEMRQAFVCRELVGLLAGIDYGEAFTASTPTEAKLLARLTDLVAVCGEACAREA